MHVVDAPEDGGTHRGVHAKPFVVDLRLNVHVLEGVIGGRLGFVLRDHREARVETNGLQERGGEHGHRVAILGRRALGADLIEQALRGDQKLVRDRIADVAHVLVDPLQHGIRDARLAPIDVAHDLTRGHDHGWVVNRLVGQPRHVAHGLPDACVARVQRVPLCCGQRPCLRADAAGTGRRMDGVAHDSRPPPRA